ncbi:hypothetical protein BH09GEM1_BH09GEM1_47930 [soil metagenome]
MTRGQGVHGAVSFESVLTCPHCGPAKRGGDACERLPVLLRMRELQDLASSEIRRMLCVLFVRFGEMPTNPRTARLLQSGHLLRKQPSSLVTQQVRLRLSFAGRNGAVSHRLKGFFSNFIPCLSRTALGDRPWRAIAARPCPERMLLSGFEFCGDLGSGFGRPCMLGVVNHTRFSWREVGRFRVGRGRENNCAYDHGER